MPTPQGIRNNSQNRSSSELNLRIVLLKNWPGLALGSASGPGSLLQAMSGGEVPMSRRLLLVVLLAIGTLLAGAAPAAADHTHFRVVGNGQCVLLAPDGGEKYVQLPHADQYPANRQHPLHVNVHLGRPGQVGDIYVAYGADGVLTADALRLCGGTFLNR
jgi:hypothetical protein